MHDSGPPPMPPQAGTAPGRPHPAVQRPRVETDDNLVSGGGVIPGMGSGHDEEFRDFVHGSSQRLLRVAYALTGDHGAAEDLLQDVLVRLYTRWRRVDEPLAYCRRALVNGSVNRRRGRRRRPEVPLDPAYDRIDVDALSRTDDRDELVRALALLPAGQRAVLVLRFLEDLSEADTAAALGCSAGTVKSQTSRALGRLRVVLNEPETTTARGPR